MKPTPRDLMVARAVLSDCMERWDLPFLMSGLVDSDLITVIESLPEPAEQEQAAQGAGHSCYRCGSFVAERDGCCDNRHWCDSIAAARAEGARAERERWESDIRAAIKRLNDQA